MFHFKSPLRYGVMDFAHAPHTRIDSLYYADDNRVEIVGDRGVLFVNRCTARTVDLPELMMFRDGETRAIPVDRVEWHDSFIDCTRHLLSAIQTGAEPVLDGPAGKAVLQFSIAAHESARTGREVRPDDVS
jgi:predicted dehydrogenase